VWPDLGDIVYVILVFGSIGNRHHLDEPRPGGEVLFLDFVVEIVGRPVLVLDALSNGFVSHKVFDTLVGFKVILDEVSFTFVVDPFKSVG